MTGGSTAGGPIDIFIDVDSPTTKNNAEVVLMKSPSQASTLQRTASPTRSMNNLEARIKQRQNQMRSEMGNKNAGGITTMSTGGAA